MKVLPRLSIFLLFSASLCAARIQWKFGPNKEGYPVFNITVGTPGVLVELELARNSYDADLEIPSTNTEFGVYNPNISSTFERTGDLYFFGEYEGETGLETFQVGKVTLGNLPFSVYDSRTSGKTGSLGLGRPADGSISFVETILKVSNDPVAVLTYDQVPDDNTNSLSGTLTLAGYPDDCSTDWTRVKEVKFDMDFSEQWVVNVDRLSAGKYSFANPGQVAISFTNSILAYPQTTYYQILQAVGAARDDTIDCNTNVTITYTIGGLDIVLGPEVYLSREKDNPKICYFNGEDRFGGDNYYLPVTVLKDRCLLVDFSTKEVGFAQRKR